MRALKDVELKTVDGSGQRSIGKVKAKSESGQDICRNESSILTLTLDWD